jgi:hypothetical protein
MIKRILAAAIITLATVASAAALTGDANAAVQLLLTGTISSQTALTSTVRQSITNADTTEEASALFQAHGRSVSLQNLNAFAANPQDDGALAVIILQALGVKSINGQPVAPATAYAVLVQAGVNMNGSPASIVAQVLNNPVIRNAVLRAAQQPITPMTPRT